MKATQRLLGPIAAGLLFAGGAQAASLESYLNAGSNVIEDDSNEYIFRPTATGYDLVTTGNIMVGDVLVQMLDFPIINGVNIDSNGDELSGVALNVVEDISAPTFIDPDGPQGPNPGYNAVNITFGQASAADWNIIGVDTTALGFDASNLISLLYWDTSNNLDVYTDSIANVGDALDGTLAFGLSLVPATTDFIFAQSVPLDIGTFAPSAGEIPGVTIYGQFFYGLDVAYEGLAGQVPGSFDGSGNNLVTDRINIAAVIDDTQASFQYVPAPATVLLMGLGLVGMGLTSKRGRKA